jgi:hypothetical protein
MTACGVSERCDVGEELLLVVALLEVQLQLVVDGPLCANMSETPVRVLFTVEGSRTFDHVPSIQDRHQGTPVVGLREA